MWNVSYYLLKHFDIFIFRNEINWKTCIKPSFICQWFYNSCQIRSWNSQFNAQGWVCHCSTIVKAVIYEKGSQGLSLIKQRHLPESFILWQILKINVIALYIYSNLFMALFKVVVFRWNSFICNKTHLTSVKLKIQNPPIVWTHLLVTHCCTWYCKVSKRRHKLRSDGKLSVWEHTQDLNMYMKHRAQCLSLEKRPHFDLQTCWFKFI